MVRQWGSLFFTACFAIGGLLTTRWFVSIANKNLDYVGLGMNIRDKTDAYVIYVTAMFFVTLVVKIILLYLFSIKPNFVFDMAVFLLLTFVGVGLIVLKVHGGQ
jgi:hypothetical protein